MSYLIIAMGLIIVLLIFRLLTVRAQYQGALKEKENALGRFKTLFDIAPFPMIVTSLKTNRVLFYNKASAKQYKGGSEVMVGKLVTDFYVFADQRQEMIDILMQTGEVNEFKCLQRDNENNHFWVLVSAVKTVFDGEPALLAIASNITTYISQQEEMETKLAEIEVLKSKLEFQVVSDHLTGLYNRRYFDETLKHYFERNKRENLDLVVSVIDLDYFKNINDIYGHAVGDEVLQMFGEFLKINARKSDIISRIGGEEFAIIMLGSSKEDAIRRCEDLKTRYANKIHTIGGNHLKLTFSAGLACYEPECCTVAELVSRADKALYIAKETGRNRVVEFGNEN